MIMPLPHVSALFIAELKQSFVMMWLDIQQFMSLQNDLCVRVCCKLLPHMLHCVLD